MSGQRASIALKFIVVGGGHSGLAAAYTLQRAGHHVLLLESTDGTSRSKAGLRSPPNMTNLLNQWGLGPILKNSSEECKKVDYFTHTGEYMGAMPVEDQFLEDLMAEFRFLQHGQLQSLLFDMARHEGVTFQFNSRVVRADCALGYVKLQTGERLYADIIVGADGYDSILRPLVTEFHEFENDEKHLVLNFIVPLDVLRADNDLAPFMSPTVWTFWFGDGFLLHATVINAGGDYSVCLTQRYDRPIQKGDLDWRDCCPLDRYGLDMNKFEPRTKKLLSLATTVYSRVFQTRQTLDNLVCEHSRIVLVGEAAHPLLPGGNHSTALAIEDAQTLGWLFSKLQHHGQVSRLLTAYDEIRQPRCSAAQQHEYAHGCMLKSPLGPIQEMRDAALRKTLVCGDVKHIDEDAFRDAWDPELVLYAHNATHKAEDWWGQWGYSITKSQRVSGLQVFISIANTISKSSTPILFLSK